VDVSEELIMQVLRNMNETVIRTDSLNKRLVTCVSVIAISFCLCILGIVASYFFSDYDYIDTKQELIMQDMHIRQNIKTGGE
jgi:hypothetical protein